jgi:phosphatidylinositol 4-kinase
MPTPAEVEEMRKLRNDHFIFFSKFINKLVKTSLDLKLIPEGERKDRLKAEVAKANRSIRIWASKHLDKRICYHEGVIIPFRKEHLERFDSTLVVNIVENECSCYNTRKRVPYRIVLETIDMKDLRNYQARPRKGDKDKTTVISMTDTFLDDVPEVQQPIAPIVDE